MLGASPVFVDVDTDTFNMSPDDLQIKIEETKRLGKLRPKMIIPVDLFGLPADYLTIGQIAHDHDLAVLADSAQSFGAQLNNKMVGNIVGMTATSFFPAKTLGCYGDAGAIFSDSAARAEILRSVLWHGTDPDCKESVRLGMNARMDSLQAAVLLVKLSIFEDELQRRRRIAQTYDRFLVGEIALPGRPRNSESAWSLYSIVLENRDKIKSALTEAEIPSAVYYPQPLHKMAAFEVYGPNGGLPNSEFLSRHILSLPMHPYLTDDQIRQICETVISAL
jgi:dTDP-4-amino-4,6-dideoxygalactose transaminase